MASRELIPACWFQAEDFETQAQRTRTMQESSIEGMRSAKDEERAEALALTDHTLASVEPRRNHRTEPPSAGAG